MQPYLNMTFCTESVLVHWLNMWVLVLCIHIICLLILCIHNTVYVWTNFSVSTQLISVDTKRKVPDSQIHTTLTASPEVPLGQMSQEASCHLHSHADNIVHELGNIFEVVRTKSVLLWDINPYHQKWYGSICSELAGHIVSLRDKCWEGQLALVQCLIPKVASW